MSRQLDLDRPLADALRAVARKLISAAAADLRNAQAGGNVHAARRDLKRLRSLILLIRPAIGRDRARMVSRRVKVAADLLAGARRFEALTLAAEKLALPADTSGAVTQAVAARFAGLHAKAALERNAGQALAMIEALRKDIRAWPLPRQDRRFLLEGLRDTYGSARRLLRKALRSGDDRRLHDARTLVIHTQHHLDLLRGLWPAMFATWVAEMTVLREALGDINDYSELWEATRQLPEDSRSQLDAGLVRRRGELLEIAMLKSRQILAEKPGDFVRRMDAMWSRPTRD